MENNLPFGSTGLRKELLDILAEDSFSVMSPVQAKTIPLLLKGKNVLSLAPTGTGKTLAYALPILNDLVNDGHVQAVILSPTVALLDQVKVVFENFSKRLGYVDDAIKAVYGQKDFNRAKPLVLLTTPLLFRSALSHYPFNKLKRVIIDEGDMIAFDGFREALESLRKPREEKMISFFSASLNVQDIKRVRSAFRIDAVVDVREAITNVSVSHHLIDIRENSKADALISFLALKHPYKAIVFCSTKNSLYALDKALKEKKYHHLLVEGGLDKRDIKRVLDSFRKDEEKLLIATDYVSRGLDIPDVDAIVSIDLPSDTDYYFHRAGRAGRFNAPGDSYVFFSYGDEESVKGVKALVRRQVSFDLISLKKDGLKVSKGPYQFRNLGKKDRAESELLQKKIRHAVNEVKTDKVKPGYRKKVARAVDLVKFKHRRKIVLTNITKAGGNATDFHMDRKRSTKKR